MTDLQASRAVPRITLTPLEGRLYIIAVLAGVYLFAWRAIAGTTTPSAAPRPSVAEVAPAHSLAVWLDDLPVAKRPALLLPTGWRLASGGEPAITLPAPRMVRAPASRPLRVRTRSS